MQPCRILVPGCGSGWEVAELSRRGFEVVGLDYTEAAVARGGLFDEPANGFIEIGPVHDAITYAGG